MGGRFDWVDSFRLEDSLVDGVVDIFSEDDSPKDRLMEEVNARGVRFITWLLLLLLEPSARMGVEAEALSCLEELPRGEDTNAAALPEMDHRFNLLLIKELF